MNIHILRTDSIARPWWPTHERLPSWTEGKIWTDCCGCKVAAEQTDCRIICSWEPPIGGMGCYQEEPLPWQKDRCDFEPAFPTGAYYEDRIEIRCAEGFGCNANPRKKWGRHLRETWRHGL
jgi:hypothetical protein